MVDDATLIDAFTSGDTDAFEALLERYQHRVFRTVLALTGNYHDAEELAQDIFVILFNKLKDFKQQSSFATWLHIVIKNTVRNYWIKKRLRWALSLDWLMELGKAEIPDQAFSAQAEAETREETVLLNQAMQQLSPKLREALVLREFNELSYDEIANVLNCSLGTVKSRLARAKENLSIAYQRLDKGGERHETRQTVIA